MPRQVRAQSNLQWGLHESDVFLGPLISFYGDAVHIVLLWCSLPSGSAVAMRVSTWSATVCVSNCIHINVCPEQNIALSQNDQCYSLHLLVLLVL